MSYSRIKQFFIYRSKRLSVLIQIVKLYFKLDSKVISDIDVENNLEEFSEKLDTGFFLRYERCSAAEKEIKFAMVKCDELPCTIANIAEIMKKSINSISTAEHS